MNGDNASTLTLTEIEEKIRGLESEAEEIRRMKADYVYAKQFREMLVREPND